MSISPLVEVSEKPMMPPAGNVDVEFAGEARHPHCAPLSVRVAMASARSWKFFESKLRSALRFGFLRPDQRVAGVNARDLRRAGRLQAVEFLPELIAHGAIGDAGLGTAGRWAST